MKVATVVLMLAAGWLVGCAVEAAPLRSAAATPDENFNAVWDATTEVLREYRFAIDRADRRAGVITTFPLLGRHWFEFWRADAAGPDDVLEGTLQTVYRRATVTIRRPASGGETAPALGDYVAAVEVRVSRSNRPAAQVTSASEAFEMFLRPERMVRGVGGGESTEAATARTVDLGRDEKLEKILRLRINSLAAKKLTVYPRPAAAQ
jgi:hypothetical protein